MIVPEELVPHMRLVLETERDMRDLSVMWQMIEATAAISCPEAIAPMMPTLIDMRLRFDRLKRRLIDLMVIENQSELAEDLRAKAQCAIDILVRNLYERTADVGFLAVDDDVVRYCAAAPAQPAQRRAIEQRLAEYQSKYTVYDDIALLGPDGSVLARLDASSPLAATADPIVRDALASRAYVERFAACDLAPDGRPALLYAHRIAAADGRAVGVLVLRFRFVDEMQRIFGSVVDDPQRVVVTLVDEARQVVATSDASHIALGSQFAALPEGTLAMTSFAGRDYLAMCCGSAGYQGYLGPRWRAVAMVSLLTAFRQRGAAADPGEEAVPLDNAELIAAQADADTMQRELRRVLWNGGIMIGRGGADRLRLKSVLRQLSATGSRTRTLVRGAMHAIYRVSLARGKHQARELARLAADVMDRNLYERANDCRWWALSPVFQRRLAEAPSSAGTAEMQRALKHIHGLYTVYSQLVVFDAQGRLRAASDDSVALPNDVPAAWLDRTRSLAGSQRYAVTDFEPTTLHAEGATYVYLAAIRPPGSSSPAGGIAIVFYAAREFGAMLRDIVHGQPGFAAFVDLGERTLAATDDSLGTAALREGSGAGGLVVLDEAHYACARVRTEGYREFKRSDGYDNGVSAVVGLRLGACERRRGNLSDIDLVVPAPTPQAKTVELALFQVGSMRYAVPAEGVVQALPQQSLHRLPPSTGLTVGMVEVRVDDRPSMVAVGCARRLFGIQYPARRTDGVNIVLRAIGSEAPVAAMRVDDVLDVIEVSVDQVHAAPPVGGTQSGWVAGIVDCAVKDGEGTVLVQVLAHDRLLQALAAPRAALPAVEVPPAREAAARPVSRAATSNA